MVIWLVALFVVIGLIAVQIPHLHGRERNLVLVAYPFLLFGLFVGIVTTLSH
jgi:hypothetical protein